MNIPAISSISRESGTSSSARTDQDPGRCGVVLQHVGSLAAHDFAHVEPSAVLLSCAAAGRLLTRGSAWVEPPRPSPAAARTWANAVPALFSYRREVIGRRIDERLSAQRQAERTRIGRDSAEAELRRPQRDRCVREAPLQPQRLASRSVRVRERGIPCAPSRPSLALRGSSGRLSAPG